MSDTMSENSTSSDRKPSPWDSIGARAAADLNTPGVVEEIFDAGREHQRRLSADIAAGVVIEESDVEDIYWAGREYQRRHRKGGEGMSTDSTAEGKREGQETLVSIAREYRDMGDSWPKAIRSTIELKVRIGYALSSAGYAIGRAGERMIH